MKGLQWADFLQVSIRSDQRFTCCSAKEFFFFLPQSKKESDNSNFDMLESSLSALHLWYRILKQSVQYFREKPRTVYSRRWTNEFSFIHLVSRYAKPQFFFLDGFQRFIIENNKPKSVNIIKTLLAIFLSHERSLSNKGAIIWNSRDSRFILCRIREDGCRAAGEKKAEGRR